MDITGTVKKEELEARVPLINLGLILREARKKANLTQEDLAERIGTKRSYISRIEKNAGSIKINTLIKLIEDGLGGKVDISIVM